MIQRLYAAACLAFGCCTALALMAHSPLGQEALTRALPAKPEPDAAPPPDLQAQAKVLPEDVDPMQVSEAPEKSTFVFRLSGEIDGDHGHQEEASLDYTPTPQWLISTEFSHSNLAAIDSVPSSPQTSTNFGSLSLERGFGLCGLGAGITAVQETDLLASRRYFIKPYLEWDSWRIEANLSRRSADFDRFSLPRDLEFQTRHGLVKVNGSVQAKSRDTGLGASLDFKGETWHFYTSYDHYAYSAIAIDTAGLTFKGGTGTLTPEITSLLLDRVVSRLLKRLIGPHDLSQAGLLDYSATIGTDARIGRITLGAELAREMDHFTSSRSDSITGLLSVNTSARTYLELRLGTTRTDQLGTVWVTGLTFAIHDLPKA